MERLQKIIADRGLCSRRKAEKLIRAGKVTCNGRTASLGDQGDPDRDEILVEGKPLPQAPRRVCIMLNKPRGFVTTLSDDRGRPTCVELVQDCEVRVVPIGRLDMDSEGLLLLTNNGDLCNRVLHPRGEVEKCYLVWGTGFTQDGLRRLREPVTLDGYTIRRPQVRVKRAGEDRALLEIVIHEGRNRQIRRMCALAGMEVRRLMRVREGKLSLGDLPSGAWRPLSESEIRSLLE